MGRGKKPLLEKLELKELENIFGGISREEYCENLRKIIANNKLSEKALAGWTIGYSTHCVEH